MSNIEAALAARNLKLPKAAAPVADYVPTVEAGGMLYLSGQLPFLNGEVMRGRLGEDTDIAVGKQAAEACGLMIVAQLKAALGDLDRVERIVRLGVFVASDPRFTDQPKVADGASSLMVALFGDKGRHAQLTDAADSPLSSISDCIGGRQHVAESSRTNCSALRTIDDRLTLAQ